ncbi:hypothetical protein DFJ66_2756 [Saccharothrix variisporea]|uniref:Leucine rich repeat (LRR) protein n=1 Tax=Saccharothrix variisporea TaxID=543527 RepID=A0A495X8P4_9PSEU|nr:hypothetical protein DFJ66_2756 [Saccharothrix variisporea]
MFGLEDLSDLTFATDIHTLNLGWCDQLSWLTGITRWSRSLKHLTISGCEGLDFDHPRTSEALHALSALKSVTIRSTAPLDLTALASDLGNVEVTEAQIEIAPPTPRRYRAPSHAGDLTDQ